jgi:AcrR family transcriptional regulator
METNASPPRRSLRPDDGRLVRGRRSRARIRAAARELFRERGFDRTTLRAIAERAGMGASSIYRHIRSKEELLVDELAELQEEAWRGFRKGAPREASTRDRVRRFLDAEHALLASDPDFTIVALRATTHPEARVARRVLALQDRSVGLLTEILMAGRARGELDRDVDPIAAARTVCHVTSGARLAWANGLQTAEECRQAVDGAVELLFRGVAPPSDPAVA